MYPHLLQKEKTVTMNLTITPLSEKPDSKPAIEELNQRTWPSFLLHGDVPHWERLYHEFASYQLLFWGDNEELIAVAHTIPFTWKGILDDLPTTLSQVTNLAMEDLQNQNLPTHLCLLSLTISKEHQKKGLSSQFLQGVTELAREKNLGTILIPLRLSLKHLYPLTKMESYMEWKNKKGETFDPGLRLHLRRGGRILQVNPQAVTVTGTVEQWEEWTGIEFPQSGFFIVPGAHQPVEIDLERDMGRYFDPNIWLEHLVKDN